MFLIVLKVVCFKGFQNLHSQYIYIVPEVLQIAVHVGCMINTYA